MFTIDNIQSFLFKTANLSAKVGFDVLQTLTLGIAEIAVGTSLSIVLVPHEHENLHPWQAWDAASAQSLRHITWGLCKLACLIGLPPMTTVAPGDCQVFHVAIETLNIETLPLHTWILPSFLICTMISWIFPP